MKIKNTLLSSIMMLAVSFGYVAASGDYNTPSVPDPEAAQEELEKKAEEYGLHDHDHDHDHDSIQDDEAEN